MARTGINPAKKFKKIKKDKKLHVIIPVYIPNHHGYFKDSLEIFKNCLNSLHGSKSCDLNITVVLNGCDKSVVEFCQGEVKFGRINDLMILSDNIGKVNAILKGVTGSDAELFLVTDADVLFKKGFDCIIYRFFKDRRAGFLGLQPVYGKSSYLTSWTRVMLARRMKSVLAEETDIKEHVEFQKSIGKEKIETLKKISVVKISGLDCVLGTGHFCFATHRSTFENVPKLYTEYFISKGTERTFLDQPSFYTGLLRLSLRTSVALHMGNRIEPWMSKEISNNVQCASMSYLHDNSIPKRRRFLFPKVVLKIIEKIF
jgi:hypothetical protein